MSNYISAEKMIQERDLKPFELFDWVLKGLQPYDMETGQKVPPTNKRL
jgi:hypothetical protein